MYILASQVHRLPVVALQTGEVVAYVTKPMVDELNLSVAALGCSIGSWGRRTSGVILMRDIRQVATDAVVIDSFDEIEDVSEIVRLKDIALRDFDPMEKLVISESGQKLGKVEDYTVNLKTNMLQKLYVHQSLMKSIIFNNLVIDRTQIIDISPKHFTVKDASVKASFMTPQAIPQK